MDITIFPEKLSGNIRILPSKSQAHRYLICAAMSDKPTNILCPETSRDMDTTAACLNRLGASIQRFDWGYHVTPVHTIPKKAQLNCRDSGSTLRFLLPVAGALGIDTIFHLEGRLSQRPMSPLWEEMERMGCTLSRPSPSTIHCSGKLKSGTYRIQGNISSQFITGLLLAFPLIGGNSSLTITGTLESKPYVDLTVDAMKHFGVTISGNYQDVCGNYKSSDSVNVEGDWSNGAFFLTAKALGNNINADNLSDDSVQGDRIIQALLPAMAQNITINCIDIPDLIPVLSVFAAHNQGAVFTGIQRLRLKESDRVESIIQMLTALGGKADATEDTLTVHGTGLYGGIVDSCNDHRIAMSAAIAASVCKAPVTVLGAECVQKSYPNFWEEYRRLGGNYEQYLR